MSLPAYVTRSVFGPRRLLGILVPMLSCGLIWWITSGGLPAADWKPAQGPLMTRWSQELHPERVHREYPRPQLVRADWQNLNGLWDYAVVKDMNSSPPANFGGQILVPFPIESALSGVMRRVGPDEALWYRRSFELPEDWRGRNVVLHFGAVDWETTVFVNGHRVGVHRGGYDPFSFDITAALQTASKQELIVRVVDPTDASTQPRGKQIRNPHGIWYTPTTGIWQTVWLEPGARRHVERIVTTTDAELRSVSIAMTLAGEVQGVQARVRVLSNGQRIVEQTIALAESNRARISIPEPKLWTPDAPFLYDLQIELLDKEQIVDTVSSYFGMRTVGLTRDDAGRNRLALNGQPLFHFGPLDQGFWPDGLYTAPSDEALRYDIEMTKKLGFNMCRKHVKVEPDRWYYWCDKLGLLVWQDMPSGDRYIGPNEPDITRSPESARQFETELLRMIDSLENHPSIVMWVPFNEGWGQFDTKRIAELVKRRDPTRLVNSVSGWADRGVGDVHDIHVYPGPDVPKREPERAAVLGEYGGLGLPVKGHTWQDEKNWGYRTYKNAEELTDAYLQLTYLLRPLVGEPGLAAAVYTQTTDVEIEVNGLLTYDREVVKMPLEKIAAANRRLYQKPPTMRTLVPTSEAAGLVWRYTFELPVSQRTDEAWSRPGFDDSSWKDGLGGFGQRETPGSIVRTEWTNKDIWLRREFELPADFKSDEIALRIHHDEDVEVYVNGTLIGRSTGYTTAYALRPTLPAGRAALRAGKNLLAVHCRQTGGGQYIDVGIVGLKEAEEVDSP